MKFILFIISYSNRNLSKETIKGALYKNNAQIISQDVKYPFKIKLNLKRYIKYFNTNYVFRNYRARYETKDLLRIEKNNTDYFSLFISIISLSISLIGIFTIEVTPTLILKFVVAGITILINAISSISEYFQTVKRLTGIITRFNDKFIELSENVCNKASAKYE